MASQTAQTSDNSIRGLVARWWADATRNGTQLTYPEAVHDNTVAIGADSNGWFGAVDTDTLYNDFLLWLTDNGYEPISKQAFMNVFYSVSGARRGRSRKNQARGSLIYVAVFDHPGGEVPLDTAVGM